MTPPHRPEGHAGGARPVAAPERFARIYCARQSREEWRRRGESPGLRRDRLGLALAREYSPGRFRCLYCGRVVRAVRVFTPGGKRRFREVDP